MRHPIRVVAPVLAAMLVLGGCGAPPEDTVPDKVEAAHVEEVDGQPNLHRITLTARAAERLGIETAEVATGDRGRLQVPYSSLIYDADGGAWAYVVDGDLTYVRNPVTVAEVVSDNAGDYALLEDGPGAGETVVTVGVAELFGTEFEVGH